MKVLIKELLNDKFKKMIKLMNSHPKKVANKLIVVHKASLTTHSKRSLLEELYFDLSEIEAELEVISKSTNSHS